MQFSRIPGTNLTTSRLGLGTASLHHLILPFERRKWLFGALDSGYTHFDTARMYGEGLVEREIGKHLCGTYRKNITIATKVGLHADPFYEKHKNLMLIQRAARKLIKPPFSFNNHVVDKDFSISRVQKSFEKSLNALRTDWVDILFVHEPEINDISALYKLSEWLLKQKENGSARYIGIAGNSLNCVSITKEIEGVFDVLQVEDSLDKHEADLLISNGKKLQITYGYMRLSSEYSSVMQLPHPSGLSVVKDALARNSDGVVLVSSRKIERLQALSRLAV
jgi:D-threo-aldose 1-dehydrogenase